MATPRKYLSYFFILHLLGWSVLSYLFRPSLPHDVIEGIAWGNNWLLSYSKHPPLTAWSLAFVTNLFPDNFELAVYSFSQVLIVITMLLVYLLSKNMVSKQLAVAATIFIELIHFHNLNSINLTPDTMQTPIWALICLVFYKAITKQNLWQWCLVGLVFGLGMLTKYSTAILGLCMALVVLFTSQGRRSLRHNGIYCAAIIALSIFLIHIFEAYNLHQSPLNYAIKDAANYRQKGNNLYFIISYLTGQALAISGILIGLSLCFKLATPYQWQIKEKFNLQFVIIMGLGPWLITFTLAACGQYIVHRWATPYYFLSGLVVVMLLRPSFDEANFRIFSKIILVFGGLFLAVRTCYLVFAPSLFNKYQIDAYLPNQEIAKLANDFWREKYQEALPQVGGDHYLAAAIATYAQDKPMFIEHLSYNTLLTNEKFLAQGGIMAWNIYGSDTQTWMEDFKNRQEINIPELGNCHIDLQLYGPLTLDRKYLIDKQPKKFQNKLDQQYQGKVRVLIALVPKDSQLKCKSNLVNK